MPPEEVSTETETPTQEVVTEVPEETAPTEAVTPETETVVEDVPTEVVAEVEAPATDEAAAEDSEDATADAEAPTRAPETLEEALAENTKLRRESADKRIKAREATEKLQAVEQYFEGTPEEYRQSWLELAKAFAENPEDPDVRAVFAELAGVEQTGDDTAATPTAAINESEVFANLKAYSEEQRVALAVEREQSALFLKTKELGYDPEATAEDNSVEYGRHRLLWQYVASQPEGARDLEAAHAQVQAYEQSLFDTRLAEMKQANVGAPAVSGAGSAQVPIPEREPASAHEVMENAYEKSIRLAEEQASRPRS